MLSSELGGDVTSTLSRYIAHECPAVEACLNGLNKFMDIVLRLYSAYGSRKNENGQELLIPTGLVQMLGNSEKFTRYGYAFVMGLEGCYEKKEEK